MIECLNIYTQKINIFLWNKSIKIDDQNLQNQY